ncbi:MAG: signal peptidase I [Woeseiaceae bacterium]
MRLTGAMGTFIAALVVPGSGYWIVGRRRSGLATAVAVAGIVMVFAWTRLLLDPAGYYALLLAESVFLLATALHAATLAFRSAGEKRNWRFAIASSVACYAALYVFFSVRDTTLGYETFVVPASSMAPTILRGDYILVDTWAYRHADPEAGDVVVFTQPQTGIKYVKRVIGTPSDTVALVSNVLVRNGERIDEPYTLDDDNAVRIFDLPEQTVPPDDYLVLGDNRNNSRDSRFFGAIPRGNIVGKVRHVFFASGDDARFPERRIPMRFD